MSSLVTHWFEPYEAPTNLQQLAETKQIPKSSNVIAAGPGMRGKKVVVRSGHKKALSYSSFETAPKSEPGPSASASISSMGMFVSRTPTAGSSQGFATGRLSTPDLVIATDLSGGVSIGPIRGTIPTIQQDIMSPGPISWIPADEQLVATRGLGPGGGHLTLSQADHDAAVLQCVAENRLCPGCGQSLATHWPAYHPGTIAPSILRVSTRPTEVYDVHLRIPRTKIRVTEGSLFRMALLFLVYIFLFVLSGGIPWQTQA